MRTLDISDHGALIESGIEYPLGAEVLLYQPGHAHNGIFRVIWSKQSVNGWKIALERQERDAIHSWGYH